MVMPRASPVDLVQRAARPHPQSAAGDPAHQPVHDQIPLAAGDMVRPGEGHQGAVPVVGLTVPPWRREPAERHNRQWNVN